MVVCVYHYYFFEHRSDDHMFKLCGNHAVESDVLKSSAMNGARSPLNCLTSNVGAVSN